MDLLPAEVVAPHFAVPIVGVILCALLVFAFGFKSPAQPPSFNVTVDEDDRRRLSSKKRKAKDLQKQGKPLLNGHTAAASVTKATVGPSKQKVEKASSPKSKAKDAADKAEAKDSKRTPLDKRTEKSKPKAEPAEAVTPPATEDDVDGGWVQQLSKKDRKTRRKEEEKTSMDVTGSASEIKVDKSKKSGVDAAVEAESPDSSPSKRKKKKAVKEEVEVIKQEEVVEVTVEEEPIPVVDPEENPKDKRNRRKKDSPAPEPEPVKPIKKEPAKDLVASTEEDSAEVVAKSKSKKKKKKAEDEKESADTAVVCSLPKLELPKAVTEVEEILKPVEGSLADALQEEVKEETSKEAEAPSGSNVAFDELGDVWQDAKPQKKKKKARRD